MLAGDQRCDRGGLQRPQLAPAETVDDVVRVKSGYATARPLPASAPPGLSYRAWQRQQDALYVFADVRDAFKPAAFDFGPEVEGPILEPETATSYEVGVKGHLAGGRLGFQLAGFQMDFENLVLSQRVNGLPTRVNAGRQRFEGIELELDLGLPHDLRWQLAASRHDARFRDFERLFDGVPTQLRGNFLELAPRNLAATDIVWAPDHGWRANAAVRFVGERFLNQRNTAQAPSYTAWSAGVGYRFGATEVRLDAENLSDTRPPVVESELGDAQFYRLPARHLVLAVRHTFGGR